MGYTKRPFQPDLDYDDQVPTELERANENFKILSEAFVDDDPELKVVKNADTVDGYHASQVPVPNAIPVALSDGKLDRNWLPDINVSVDADTVDGYHASNIPQANTIPVSEFTGKLNKNWIPKVDEAILADNALRLNNCQASQVPMPNAIPIADNQGKIDPNWLPSGIGGGDADTVDGFHASLTPSPNKIVPLNDQGILDLSPTYVKSNIYTFRRVDLTGASQDYDLQVGEEGLITFVNTNVVPLRVSITSVDSMYEIILVIEDYGSYLPHFILPNNNTYASSFNGVGVWWGTDKGTDFWYCSETYDRFFILGHCSSQNFVINVKTRELWGVGSYKYSLTNGGVSVFHARWHSNLVPWTSLGTLVLNANLSGTILIRRLL